MKKTNFIRIFIALSSLVLGLGFSTQIFGAATIVIVNNDPAGVGFNDATIAAPVGGNPGTTLGQQRLNAFQHAANIWGATLTSTATINIRSQWTALTCTSSSAVLGSAGAITVSRDFTNAPFGGTWYGASLANKLFGSDLDTAQPEITANFNINLGNAGCLTGTFFYLGIDGNHGTNIDLVAVLLHEFSHGLGFQTFTNGTTGAQLSGSPSVYDRFLLDTTTGKSWFNMTNAERVSSAINSRKLVWTGPQVQADVPSILSLGVPIFQISSPGSLAGNYDVGTASFGPALTTGGVSGNVVLALDASDVAGPSTTDGCSPLTNAAQIAGNIAILDRGTCGFVIKVLNAQNAGAIAVLVADNVAGGPPAGLGGTDPTIVIPSARITLADGNAIKAQLAGGVAGVLKLDNTVRAGADAFGKAQLHSPNPFQSGSSVSHWDPIASPNQLMEPSINGDLTQVVTAPTDLTFSLLKDIGWVGSTLPTAVAVTGGNNQTAITGQNFSTPLSVTVNPVVAGLTVTFTAPTAGASGTFADSGSRPESENGSNFLTLNSRVATALTNASGVATSPSFKANATGGTYTVNANVVGAGTTGVQLTNSVPTAAHVIVSGRVVSSDGYGLARALVVLTGQDGSIRSTYTNTFGYYSIGDLNAGDSVVLSVRSKAYEFAPQVVTLLDGLTTFDLVALP